MKYRDQVAYSAHIDMMQAAVHVDVPETESLYFMDEIYNYIAMSAPANLTRKPIVSTGVGALYGSGVWGGGPDTTVGSYSQTWKDMLIQLNRSFAGGINQNILHTYPYRDGQNFQWPGYTAFGANFSESWGPRLPSWEHARAIGDYAARAQYIMRQGVSRRDIVIYKHSYDWVRNNGLKGSEFITDFTLTRDGYTFDFMNPAMMQHENAYAENGVIDPEGGACKAFVIDGDQYPLTQYWAQPAADMMPLDTAQTIREYANAGVPIIVLGGPPVLRVFPRRTAMSPLYLLNWKQTDKSFMLHRKRTLPLLCAHWIFIPMRIA